MSLILSLNSISLSSHRCLMSVTQWIAYEWVWHRLETCLEAEFQQSCCAAFPGQELHHQLNCSILLLAWNDRNAVGGKVAPWLEFGTLLSSGFPQSSQTCSTPYCQGQNLRLGLTMSARRGATCTVGYEQIFSLSDLMYWLSRSHTLRPFDGGTTLAVGMRWVPDGYCLIYMLTTLHTVVY